VTSGPNDIFYEEEDGFPPLKISGKKLQGGKVILNRSLSSQFLSSLFLIGPTFENGLEIEIVGDLVSESYVKMTRQIMRDFGVDVEQRGMVFRIRPGQKYQAREYEVEADLSGASYFWAVAAVSGGTVRITGVNPDSVQGDRQFPQMLGKMGCHVSMGPDWIEVRGPES